jgi:hypothetical protein
MRKFSSLNPYRPARQQRTAGMVKKLIMEVVTDAIDQMVDINPVAEDIADDIFDLAMYNPEHNLNEMFELIDSLPVSMSNKISMKSVLQQAIMSLSGNKFASMKNRYSFNNTSSFYKTLPESDYEIHNTDMFADEMESFDEEAGDDYLYNNDGSLYQGGFDMEEDYGYGSEMMADEDDFEAEMMADELYAGRKWRGEPGKKYDKPPALDNNSCYSSTDWKGKGTPGEGTCYRLHNDYGAANSGKPGSKERAEYNRKWRQQWADSKTIKRTKKPGNNMR